MNESSVRVDSLSFAVASVEHVCLALMRRASRFQNAVGHFGRACAVGQGQGVPGHFGPACLHGALTRSAWEGVCSNTTRCRPN